MSSELIIDIKDESEFKSVCGITESQLQIIAQEFEIVDKEEKQVQYEQMLQSHFRVRKPGGGNKGTLRTPFQKVLIVLVYCKSHLTYRDLASRFGLSKSAAFDNVKRYFPLVLKALARLGAPQTVHDIEEFKQNFDEIEKIIIEVTQHPPPQSRISRTNSKTKRI